MVQRRVAVIGGGAAGLVASIAAARADAHVVLYEAEMRVGQKILKTGNGRCNLSNLHIDPHDYNDPAYANTAFEAMPPARVFAFFDDLGLMCHADEQGRVYPQTNKATSVLDVLRLAIAESDIDVRCGHPVASIAALTAATAAAPATAANPAAAAAANPAPAAAAPAANPATAHSAAAPAANPAAAAAPAANPVANKPRYRLMPTGETFDAVIIACGAGYRYAAPLLEGSLAQAHPLVPTSPMLLPLRCDARAVKGCTNLRVRCALSLYASTGAWEADEAPLACADGELQFKDASISGIAVFDLSRYAEPGMVVTVDFLPQSARDAVTNMLVDRQRRFATRDAETFLTGIVLRQIAALVLGQAGVRPHDRVADLDADRLARTLKSYPIPILGRGDARMAQVMRGGFATSAFDPRAMVSRCFDGFFVVGEALDVDGRCGGYNLHWAWTSGLLAGKAAARDAIADMHQ